MRVCNKTFSALSLYHVYTTVSKVTCKFCPSDHLLIIDSLFPKHRSTQPGAVWLRTVYWTGNSTGRGRIHCSRNVLFSSSLWGMTNQGRVFDAYSILKFVHYSDVLSKVCATHIHKLTVRCTVTGIHNM